MTPSGEDGASEYEPTRGLWAAAAAKASRAKESAGQLFEDAAASARRALDAAQVAISETYDRREQLAAEALAHANRATAAARGYAMGVGVGVTTFLGKAYENRDLLAGVAGGWVDGTGGAFRDVAAHVGYEEALRRQVEFVEAQGILYQSIERHARDKVGSMPTRESLLDSTVVAGQTLADYVNLGTVPPEIEQAYELAYPRMSLDHSFLDAVKHTDADHLGGLVSGVKGKLFEMRYLDDLNSGVLPEGYHAELAHSATQPGWDIAVFGPDATMVDAIQLKATDSVAYVQHALDRYPNIDVVTTSEVHSHLMMMDAAENVFDGHITNHAITSAVEGGIDQAVGTMHWTPSVVSLALIAYSAYNAEGLTSYQKSQSFGERSAKAYIAYLVGGAAALASGTALVGIAGGVGARMLIGSGQKKREKLDALRELGETNGLVLRRLTERLQAGS